MIKMNMVNIIGSGNVGRRIGEYFSEKIPIVAIFNDINKNVVEELDKIGHNATTDIEYTIRSSDISFVAVPIPLANDGFYNI